MKRFHILGALTAFWLVLEPGWLFVVERVSDRELFHIDSPQRAFFFRVIPWIVLAALLVTPLGYHVGGKVGQRIAWNRNVRWLSPLAGVAATLWLLFTLYILVAGLLVMGMPGWVDAPPRRGSQTPAAPSAPTRR